MSISGETHGLESEVSSTVLCNSPSRGYWGLNMEVVAVRKQLENNNAGTSWLNKGAGVFGLLLSDMIG